MSATIRSSRRRGLRAGLHVEAVLISTTLASAASRRPPARCRLVRRPLCCGTQHVEVARSKPRIRLLTFISSPAPCRVWFATTRYCASRSPLVTHRLSERSHDTRCSQPGELTAAGVDRRPRLGWLAGRGQPTSGALPIGAEVGPAAAGKLFSFENPHTAVRGGRVSRNPSQPLTWVRAARPRFTWRRVSTSAVSVAAPRTALSRQRTPGCDAWPVSPRGAGASESFAAMLQSRLAVLADLETPPRRPSASTSERCRWTGATLADVEHREQAGKRLSLFPPGERSGTRRRP